MNIVKNIKRTNFGPESLTEEVVKQRDEASGIVRVGEYLGTRKKTKYLCSYCKEIWITTPYRVWTRGQKGHIDCYNKNRNDNTIYPSYEEIHGHYWLRFIKCAEDRNIKVELTIEEMWLLYLKQDRKCYYSRY